ncbi:MAG: LysM peptidoglycan-binding domain-containing protein [Thermoleophilia bacterium]|nr:LysM peptidoglycan-binding domain-containing protein [Thermoleophilia bacterium]MDQ3857747.1 LysM peptidoglycan-binding domain-containing protein [Actinomycetota bacterium]
MVSRGRDALAGRRRVAWGARILAPLAFFGAVTALVLVVQNSLSPEPESVSPTPTLAAAPTATTGKGTGRTETPPRRRRRRFYSIRTGDTLDVVARRFNTSVDDLLRLNRGIDANSLTPGQRIRVR